MKGERLYFKGTVDEAVYRVERKDADVWKRREVFERYANAGAGVLFGHKEPQAFHGAANAGFHFNRQNRIAALQHEIDLCSCVWRLAVPVVEFGAVAHGVEPVAWREYGVRVMFNYEEGVYSVAVKPASEGEEGHRQPGVSAKGEAGRCWY